MIFQRRTSFNIFGIAAAAVGGGGSGDGGVGTLLKVNRQTKIVHVRSRITTPSGAILPEPKRTRFGFLGVICSVMTGLIIGATLSKMMANFLEEKELFVPSDDDDDDDD